MKDTAFTVLIPTHNEEGAIAAVVAQPCRVIAQNQLEGSVLVVDDASGDDTGRKALEVGARIVTTDKCRGKGAAMKYALDFVETDVVLFMDGDGQDDPNDLPGLLRSFQAGGDFIIGSRFIGELEEGSISWVNRLGNRGLTGLFNLIFATRVSDTQAGMRCMKTENARRFLSNAREYEVETQMLAKAVRRGLVIREVPVTRKRREGGRTDFRRIRNGLRIVATMFQERIS